MRNSKVLNWLIPLIIALALVSSGAGLFWLGGRTFTFTTLRGTAAQMDGQGLYRLDTVFSAAGNRGTDAVTLVIGIPLLVIAFLLYRRGSLRGGLLLAGALALFLYVSASVALGAAYNALFLVYIPYFSASFFAFVVALNVFDLSSLPAHVSPRLPRRGIAIFLFLSGGVVLLAWLSEILGAMSAGLPPKALESYTTMVTFVLDLGIIFPSLLIAGIVLLRRAALGVVLAAPLLILNALVGAMVVGQTVMQIRAGIVFAPGQLVGIVGSWLIMALVAVGFAVALLRNVKDAL